jgi:hypothetical protein
MIAVRTSICVLLAAIIVGLGGGALAAKKMRLAQTSSTTTCMMTCNSAFALCQSQCVSGRAAALQVLQGVISPGTAAGSCVVVCTNQQLSCQTTCALASPSQ